MTPPKTQLEGEARAITKSTPPVLLRDYRFIIGNAPEGLGLDGLMAHTQGPLDGSGTVPIELGPPTLHIGIPFVGSADVGEVHGIAFDDVRFDAK
jgi:hypothetical protein